MHIIAVDLDGRVFSGRVVDVSGRKAEPADVFRIDREQGCVRFIIACAAAENKTLIISPAVHFEGLALIRCGIDRGVQHVVACVHQLFRRIVFRCGGRLFRLTAVGGEAAEAELGFSADRDGECNGLCIRNVQRIFSGGDVVG